MSTGNLPGVTNAIVGPGGVMGRPDLLRVALAAYAAHLNLRAGVRMPRSTSSWGLSGRLAQVNRSPR